MTIQKKEYMRFKWSHDLKVHRVVIQVFNALMLLIPFKLKYGIGLWFRKNSPPYFQVQPGAIVVQIGAPDDTLCSGRSRAMYFSLLAGKTGKVLLIEPDAKSLHSFETLAQKKGITNLILVHKAAWSEMKPLRIFINDAHPATSFTEGTKQYDPERLSEYRVVEMLTTTVDEVIRQSQVDRVDLVSITTNGAEREILAGMKETIKNGLPYICLARTGNGYIELMGSLGYDLYTHDDRGFTFKKR